MNNIQQIDVFNILADCFRPEQVKKTQRAIDLMMVQLEECRGCNIHYDATKMEKKHYRHPFTKINTEGYFCETCQNNAQINTLFL